MAPALIEERCKASVPVPPGTQAGASTFHQKPASGAPLRLGCPAAGVKVGAATFHLQVDARALPRQKASQRRVWTRALLCCAAPPLSSSETGVGVSGAPTPFHALALPPRGALVPLDPGAPQRRLFPLPCRSFSRGELGEETLYPPQEVAKGLPPAARQRGPSHPPPISANRSSAKASVSPDTQSVRPHGRSCTLAG